MKPQNQNPISRESLEIQVTALLLGELGPDEIAAIRKALDHDPALRKFHDRMQRTVGMVREASTQTQADQAQAAAQPAPAEQLSADRRRALMAHFKKPAPQANPPQPALLAWLRFHWTAAVGMAACFIAFLGLLLPAMRSAKTKAMRAFALNEMSQVAEPEEIAMIRSDSKLADLSVDGDGVALNFETLAKPQSVTAMPGSVPPQRLAINHSGPAEPPRSSVAGQAGAPAQPMAGANYGVTVAGVPTTAKVDLTGSTLAYNFERKKAMLEIVAPPAPAEIFLPNAQAPAQDAWFKASADDAGRAVVVENRQSVSSTTPDAGVSFYAFSSPPAPAPAAAAAGAVAPKDTFRFGSVALQDELAKRENGPIGQGQGGGGGFGGGRSGPALPALQGGASPSAAQRGSTRLQIEDAPAVQLWSDTRGLGEVSAGDVSRFGSRRSAELSDPLAAAPQNVPVSGPMPALKKAEEAVQAEAKALGQRESSLAKNPARTPAPAEKPQDAAKLGVTVAAGGAAAPVTLERLGERDEKGESKERLESAFGRLEGMPRPEGQITDANGAVYFNGAATAVVPNLGDRIENFRSGITQSGLAPAAPPANWERFDAVDFGGVAPLASDNRWSGRFKADFGDGTTGEKQVAAEDEKKPRQAGIAGDPRFRQDSLQRGAAEPASERAKRIEVTESESLRRLGRDLAAKDMVPAEEPLGLRLPENAAVVSNEFLDKEVKDQDLVVVDPATGLPVAVAKKLNKGAEVSKKTEDAPPTVAAIVVDSVNAPAPQLEPPAPVKTPPAPPADPLPEVLTAAERFSTFSLNVSDVSFKLAAASLAGGALPEPATVRSEEFVNALNYHDPAPARGAKLAFAWDQARHPFEHNRDLLRFSIQTAALGRETGRPLNLVLLLDNSGSMERADRVQIIRQALGVLARQLTPADRISVVAFARTPRLWVDGMQGGDPAALVQRVGNLNPEGGTNLELALNEGYATAEKHFMPGGNNRVILLTDGAANLGNVDPAQLKQKVESFRRKNIALDCFGVGWEGYNDDLLESLSRNGDGRYGFINNPLEAAMDFAGQLAGALRVAAADVKAQVEFNPNRVILHRQIGYEKHRLTKEQFRDNTVDAAELGAAESGTALYSIQVNPQGRGPLGVVRVRYKVPSTGQYEEQEWLLPHNPAVPSLDRAYPAMRLAAVAAGFAEWLARSPYAGNVSLGALQQYLRGVPETFPLDMRPGQLQAMLEQARTISGQ